MSKRPMILFNVNFVRKEVIVPKIATAYRETGTTWGPQGTISQENSNKCQSY
jgi:hypothetical protein